MTATLDIFEALGLQVLERGWLSSNNIVFRSAPGAVATVVDTGYDTHSGQTLALVTAALNGEQLGRVLNTHLHSDHCGGNAALQMAFGCEVWVPEASFETVQRWDTSVLTFAATGQRCGRFSSQAALRIGQEVRLGAFDWLVVAAPGHDPDAVMLFQRKSGVLITADALWEERLAIIFPELAGESGFAEARGALDVIEQLAPSVVIPGHGRPFVDVAAALAVSRRRLAQFEEDPGRHVTYAERALTMFHMLEHRARDRDVLTAWLAATPIFQAAAVGAGVDSSASRTRRAEEVVARLLRDGQLRLATNNSVQID